MPETGPLIPHHGGYRNLKSFQISQLVYDVTVRFCDRYIDRRSRTHDQMVQAARSGVQNIAEGSQASATSKKMELKLTQVARASLEELKLDYEDFLRQRELTMLEPGHPALMRFKKRKCKTVKEVQTWITMERKGHTDAHRQARTHTNSPSAKERETGSGFHSDLAAAASSPSVVDRDRPCRSVSSACLAANAALSLLNLACYLLDRQVARLAADFENEGGFSERLYRIRSARRRRQ